jgi:hypothetical protein
MKEEIMDRATKALIDYGYTLQEDGSLDRGRKDERYVPVEGFREVLDTPAGPGQPATYKQEPVKGFYRYFRGNQMCFRIADRWSGVAGLDPLVQPECFEMIYPEDWVIAEYETAVANQTKWAAEAAARKAGDVS